MFVAEHGWATTPEQIKINQLIPMSRSSLSETIKEVDRLKILGAYYIKYIKRRMQQCYFCSSIIDGTDILCV